MRSTQSHQHHIVLFRSMMDRNALTIWAGSVAALATLVSLPALF
jgi:hypothetical protein